MSWSAHTGPVTAGDLDEALESLEPSPQPLPPESVEQVDAAKYAAKQLVESGAVGSGGKRVFNVFLAGHANPGHEPRDGWSNDTVTVSISQATG
jgi:hypothetical protein